MEFIEIWKNISLKLILKNRAGSYAVYPFIDSNNFRVEIFLKKRRKEGCVEIEEWGAPAHLHWGFKKIACKACLFFIVFWWQKNNSF